jgi:Tfp pilus assembly protein PilV
MRVFCTELLVTVSLLAFYFLQCRPLAENMASQWNVHLSTSFVNPVRRTNARGLVVRAVVLTVPNIWVNVWLAGGLFMDLPLATALTHFEATTKRVPERSKDAVHTTFTSWHTVLFVVLKMTGRNMPCVRSYTKVLAVVLK